MKRCAGRKLVCVRTLENRNGRDEMMQHFHKNGCECDRISLIQNKINFKVYLKPKMIKKTVLTLQRFLGVSTVAVAWTPMMHNPYRLHHKISSLFKKLFLLKKAIFIIYLTFPSKFTKSFSLLLCIPSPHQAAAATTCVIDHLIITGLRWSPIKATATKNSLLYSFLYAKWFFGIYIFLSFILCSNNTNWCSQAFRYTVICI